MTNRVFYLIGLDDDHRPVHTTRVAVLPGWSVQKAVEEEGTQMMLSGVYAKVIAAQEVEFPRRAETFDHAEDAAYLEETKVGVGDGKKGGGSAEPPAVARRITEANDR